MSLPQHVQFGVGGTVSLDTKSVPTAVTVTIRTGDGTVKVQDADATVSTIDTTITGAVDAGTFAINVTANTGLAVGGTAWLRDDPEPIEVEKVATLAVTLRRPMLYDHINGAGLEGGRVTYAVNSVTANALWWDGYAEWNVDSTIYTTSVECTRYPMLRHASAQDLFDLEPKLYDVMDGEQDVERLLDAGHEYVLGMLAKVSQDARARAFPAGQAFKSATCLASLYIHYRRRGGEAAKDLAERFKVDLKEEVDSIASSNPRDADQDRAIEDHEQISVHSVRIRH